MLKYTKLPGGCDMETFFLQGTEVSALFQCPTKLSQPLCLPERPDFQCLLGLGFFFFLVVRQVTQKVKEEK